MMNLQDNPIFAAMAVVFTVLFILEFRSFLKIWPYLANCIWRWKSNLELEDSLQLSRSRDQVALTLAVPTCMLAYSYSLYAPDIIQGLPPLLRIAAVAGAILFQIPLRAFLNWQIVMHGTRSGTFQAANGAFKNYSILLFFLLFFVGAVSMALTGDIERTRSVLMWVTGVSYMVYVFRRGQIFSSACNPFVTILYLCGLELLPTAILVLSGMLL